MRRVWLLALAALLAGCLGAERGFAPPTHEPEAPAQQPPKGDPPPIVREPPATDPAEGPAAYRMGDECARYELLAEPRKARVGDWITLTLRIENCGSVELRRATPCTAPEWHPQVLRGGSAYYPIDGAAHTGLLCLTAIGSWSLPAGETQEVSFRWNGTFEEYDENGTRFEAATPGEYPVQSVFRSWRADTNGEWIEWRAGTSVRIR